MADIAEPSDSRLVERHETWTNAGPVMSHLTDSAIQTLRERATATVADPSALGFWGFATGTWMAATVAGGFVSANYALFVVPVLILFGGVAQFIAGLYAFRRANALNATFFTCFGAFNTVAGAMLLLEPASTGASAMGIHVMFGFLLESFAFISLALAVGALRRNLVLTALLLFLGIGYCLTGIGQFGFTAGAQGGLGAVAEAGGACLFVSAFLAFYLGAAMIMNSAWHRNILPIMGEP
jgi:succinate-acetate transporter protein